MKSKLTLTIRQEIAKRTINSVSGILMVSVLSFYFALSPTVSFFIGLISLLTCSAVWPRYYYAKKVLATPYDNSMWRFFKTAHWIHALLLAVTLCAAVLEFKVLSPQHLILLALLTGFSILSVIIFALDPIIFWPVITIVFLPLIGIALWNAVVIGQSYSIYLLISYSIYIGYALLQYRALRRHVVSTFKQLMDFEITNQELLLNDNQRDYFVQLILKLLSNNESLENILFTLIRFFEGFNTGAMCSILFLNKDRKRFDKIYAPSFPESYNQALVQLDIGEVAGSCGRAAYIGERVIVENIHKSPYWAPYLAMAEAAQVDACWSEPIKNNTGTVIGTFAIYYKFPHAPSSRDIKLIEQAAELVAIILKHFEVRNMVSKTREELSLIYNSAIDSMWLIDVEEKQNYRFKSINDAFVQFTGLAREKVLGKTIEEVLQPSSLHLVREKYHLAITTGEVVDYLELDPLPNGVKVGQIRVKPIKNENGVVTKILGIAEDITEKKNLDDLLKDREADLVYAQHVAQLGSWKWEIKTDTVSWSKGIYDILELDSSKPPLPFAEQAQLYTEESWSKLSAAVAETLQTGTPYKLDLEARLPGNKSRWFVARGEVTMKDKQGQILALAGTLQDITDRKKLENNLTQALNSRDEFIAVATHELKTPLTTLLLALHGIIKNIAMTEKDKLLSRLEKIKSQGERLEKLISNLLDVTSIGAGKMHLEIKPNVNFSLIVDGVFKKHEEEIARSGSSLSKEIMPLVVGVWDESRLEQIVTNLLTNAVKYGNGKPIHVVLHQVGSMARLEVKDQGIGIAADKQDKIFERFERAVSETNYKGLGLGLWIVKEIVTALGGQIKVDSILGQGSTFTVDLPIKVEQ